MRSAQAAAAAGVSVRALRHYHRVGLLDEPHRGSNGYRDYDAVHVSRLLRIRLLAQAGVPLARVGVVIDDLPATVTELERVENELSMRIESLEAQRRLARELRERGGDVPFDVSIPGGEARDGDEWAGLDRDLTTVLYLAARPGEERRALSELYAELVQPDRAARVAEVVRRFAALTQHSGLADIDEVVDAGLALSAEYGDRTPPRPSGLRAEGLRILIDHGPFNGSQRAALLSMLRGGGRRAQQ